MYITRSLVRWGLLAGLALGGVTLLVGPERVAASFSMIRGQAQGLVDRAVSDPVAMRHQLRKLADQYPDRIQEVRREIAKVQHELDTRVDDIDMAKRVIAMTTDHLGQLKELVARAEETVQSTARPVSIRFQGVKFNVEQAYTEAHRINNVRGTYQDRLASDEQQVNFLTQQKQRLQEILDKLESEHNTYLAQMWQLERQIDSIERNERLIQLTEDQQATLASYEKFGKVGSLKQLEGKLAELRAVQEAQLQSLAKRGVCTDYEQRAREEMSLQGRSVDPFAATPAPTVKDEGTVIEPEKPAKNNGKTYAFAEPIIISE